MEDKYKVQTDELLMFITELASDEEKKFSAVVSETQMLEQKLREIEVGLSNQVDENLYFFSPVGVLEDKSDNRELHAKKEEARAALVHLQEEIGHYKQKKRKLEALRQLILKQKAEEEAEGKVNAAGTGEEVNTNANVNVAGAEEKTDANAAGAGEKVNTNADAAGTEEKTNANTAEAGEKVNTNANTAEAGDEANIAGGSSKIRSKDEPISILEFQENDRYRIASELHDSTVQTLTGLVHKTEFCLLLMDTDSVRVKLELQKMIELTKSIINEIREVIFNLRPINLSKNNLSSSVEAFGIQTQKTRSILTEIEIKGEEPETIPIWKLTLYRIFQEAVSNVVRHSGATKMKVSLTFGPDNVCLVVADNGTGFVPCSSNNDEEQNQHHFGITFMKERVNILKGECTINSQKKQGTTVTVTVPYPDEREEKNEAN